MSLTWAELEPLVSLMLAFKRFHMIYPFKETESEWTVEALRTPSKCLYRHL